VKVWEEYIHAVESGKRFAGELERLTISRFKSMLKNDSYYFDTVEVEQKFHIISNFKHTKGSFKGVPFNILPWQAFFWAYIFGLKDKADNARVVREAMLCMAKKGGKSEVGGATGVIMTLFDNEPGAECYSAANSSDQAEFSWSAGAVMCKQLIQDDEDFASYCRVYDSVNNRKIIDLETGSFFKTIAAENKTLDGVNPHFALIDEYHEAKDDLIPKNLRSGMVQRKQPLLMYATTRGFNPNGELARLEQKHIALLRGTAKDDSSMSLIFGFDPEDEEEIKRNWGKPVEEVNKKTWEKANPGIGIAPTWKGLEAMYTDAVNEGVSAQTNFLVKNLNIWVRTSKTWIPDNIWMQCAKKHKESSLQGRRAFAAFDLSSNRDLTCFGLLFPPDDDSGDFVFKCYSFMPADNVEQRVRRDRVPYMDWHKAGLVEFTEGNITDQNRVLEVVLEAGEKYDLENIYYDPWQSTKLATELSDHGARLTPFRQTVTNFNEPIRMIEELISTKRLAHGGDEVLRWMAGNVVIKYFNGLCKFDKDKSREKIDGMVVMAMCFAGYLNWLANNGASVYNDRDLFML